MKSAGIFVPCCWGCAISPSKVQETYFLHLAWSVGSMFPEMCYTNYRCGCHLTLFFLFLIFFGHCWNPQWNQDWALLLHWTRPWSMFQFVETNPSYCHPYMWIILHNFRTLILARSILNTLQYITYIVWSCNYTWLHWSGCPAQLMLWTLH